MSRGIRNIAEVLGASWHGINERATIDNFSIDSRSLQNNAQTLFFAISGPNNDGHQFISQLISSGVQNFVVSKIPAELKDKANFLVVPDTIAALQKMAAAHRMQFDFPIIGITGSNGKTIVKEWLNFLLSPDYNIIRSPKSYNSQVGVPLSVLGINENHNLGIFEAGISQPGEMEKLASVIRPTIGVLSNIGSAHDEGFSGVDEKISEKLQLFRKSSVVIYQKESLAGTSAKISNGFSWTFNDGAADVRISVEKTAKSQTTNLNVRTGDSTFTVEIPFNDPASVQNAATCLAVLVYLNYDSQTIASRMRQLFPVEMRLMVKNGINNTTIIDDSYSSDFQSLKIALDFLESQGQHKKKTVILSDIFQSGLTTDDLYKRVSQLIKSNKVNRVIGIGNEVSKYPHLFPSQRMYSTTGEFIADFPNIGFSSETILVKGARDFHFEQIVSLLEEKTHETVLEINLNAVSHNLNFYRSKLSQSTKLMVMVKAFGYGNGGLEIARLLEHHKVDYLGVAFADEGIALKTGGISLPVMVLNPESTSFASIIQYGLEPEIYSINGLHAFIKAATTKNLTDYPIHIKIDTGMHRLGFEEAGIEELANLLQSTKSVRVKSILSHLATSDDLIHQEFALSQIALFEKLSSKLTKAIGYSPMRHILNTSGITNFPQAQYDMVRLGIGIYGISNNTEEQKFLENVGTLKSIISQLRTIPPGDSVGYGRRFIADKPTVISTIPIGYADGIARSWGNGLGYVVINKRRAPIVGSVCMDMLMADCTGIECREGDSVVVLGTNPSPIEMAEKLKTIPYEILTGISQRVKRVFYRE